MSEFDPTIDAAYRYLRGHSTAELRFDDHLRAIRYVIAADGRLVASVMEAMLATMDTVLFVPDASEHSMELSVTLERFEEAGENGAVCDRWRIHHGDPPDVRWAVIHVDAARYDRMIVDGEALIRPNPLAAVEAGICRAVNTDRADDLRTATARLTGVAVPEPRLVAVDPHGLDVRSRFGVLRLPRSAETVVGGAVADPAPAEAVEAAMRAAIDRLLDGDPGDAWVTGPEVESAAAEVVARAEREAADPAGRGDGDDAGGPGATGGGSLGLRFGQPEDDDPFDDGLL